MEPLVFIQFLGWWNYLIFLFALTIILWFVLRALAPLLRIFFGSFLKRYDINLAKMFDWPLTIVIWSLSILVVESGHNIYFSPDFWKNYGEKIFSSIFILSMSFTIYQCFKIFFKVVRRKYDISVADNLQQRKVLTQIQYVEKIVFILISLLAVSTVLLRFESVARFGGGLLASAGVASVVIGFAAQESVSNLIAGFQIAFTQPFRIDDAIVVEDEWGWIEEINLTYIVVRIWDRRRLVLPIKYFTTNPFQNWTRNGAQIIGTVVLHLDYRAPVERIRTKFEELVSEHPLWDKDVKVLQVIETSEKTMEIRGLLSSNTSPKAWDLRCEVRERLIEFIRKECPEAFPRFRYSRDPDDFD